MRVIVVVQARMTSARLPGKILKKVLDKPLLEYQLERLKRSTQATEIILATSTNEADQPVEELCRRLGVLCYRGSERDVLSRVYEAAKSCQAEVVVRICGDCPLIDPSIVDAVITAFLKEVPKVDYLSNTLQRSFPRGMDCEVFSFRALEEAWSQAHTPNEREHVTPFIYWNADRYTLKNFEASVNQSKYRFTVDTEEDFKVIEKILTHLYPGNPNFCLEDVLQVLLKNPELSEINKDVQQTVVMQERIS